MEQEKLDQLWSQVEHMNNLLKLDYGEMVTIGGIFGEMKAEIIELTAKLRVAELQLEDHKKPMNSLPDIVRDWERKEGEKYVHEIISEVPVVEPWMEKFKGDTFLDVTFVSSWYGHREVVNRIVSVAGWEIIKQRRPHTFY